MACVGHTRDQTSAIGLQGHEILAIEYEYRQLLFCPRSRRAPYKLLPRPYDQLRSAIITVRICLDTGHQWQSSLSLYLSCSTSVFSASSKPLSSVAGTHELRCRLTAPSLGSLHLPSNITNYATTKDRHQLAAPFSVSSYRPQPHDGTSSAL